MPRQPWLVDALADEFRGAKGFRVDTYPGWESRGSTDFSPVGVMDHHTGRGTYNALLRYMAEGPVHPPLCNYATSRPSGGVVRITILAAGRANHAGIGELPWLGRNGGNRGTFGGEHQNDGSQPWPDQQVEAIRRCAAAILRHLGADASRRTDHEIYGNRPPGWAGRKVDRHTVDQATEDRAVNDLIARRTGGDDLAGITARNQELLNDMADAFVRADIRRTTIPFVVEFYRGLADRAGVGGDDPAELAERVVVTRDPAHAQLLRSAARNLADADARGTSLAHVLNTHREIADAVGAPRNDPAAIARALANL